MAMNHCQPDNLKQREQFHRNIQFCNLYIAPQTSRSSFDTHKKAHVKRASSGFIFMFSDVDACHIIMTG